MKYLYRHPRTRKLLSKWAGKDQCSMLSSFFSHSGTSEQKSQSGLSRTLLYQIFSRSQSLISEVLPTTWKELQNNTNKAIALQSASKTQHAFRVLTTQTPERLGKYCLFIDGLDELTGDVSASIAFLKTLASSENVRIIISSRPIPSCFVASSHQPKTRCMI